MRSSKNGFRLVATLLLVLTATAVPVGAQDGGEPPITISPAGDGDLAINGGSEIEVSGEVPAGTIEAARLLGVTDDGNRFLADSLDDEINQPPDPTKDNYYYLFNLNGTLIGELDSPCSFGVPSDTCPHEAARYAVLEVDIGGQTFASNLLPVDFTHPDVLRAEVIAPDQIRVVFTEAVRHDQGDLPRDWTVSAPSGPTVIAVQEPAEGDCTRLGVGREEITDTGCSRILQLDQSVGEDPANVSVDYEILADPRPPQRVAHRDFSHEQRVAATHVPTLPAPDLIRPAKPEITEVNGEAVGDDATRTSAETAPTVTATNITEGHTARAVARLDGDVVAESSQRTGTGPGDELSFELGELPGEDDYQLTVVVTDPNGNVSTEDDKNPPRDDGDPDVVDYTLQLTPPPPTIARINGESVGQDGTVHDNVEAPSVEVTGVREGDEVTVRAVSEDRSFDETSGPETASGDTVTVPLDALPEDGGYDLTAVRSTDAPNDSDPSAPVTYHLDTVAPTIDRALTDGGPRVIVRFSEDVLGDDLAAQWTVQPGGPVTAVTGEPGSDQRTLETAGDVEPGASLTWEGMHPLAEDYHDRAGNTLADIGLTDPVTVEPTTIRIPEPPTIATVAGQSEDGTDDQGRPVFYFNDESPVVTVADLHPDDAAVLLYDTDHDGQMETVGTSDRAGDDGRASVQYDGDDLDPGRHVFAARARTPESHGGVDSDRSGEVAYDLDLTPPTAAPPATLDGTTVQVRFNESVFGDNRAAQWRLGDGTLVTGVQGQSGTATRTLTLASAPDPDTEVVYEPGAPDVADSAYRDRHHNRIRQSQRWGLEIGPIGAVPDPPDIVGISGAEQQQGAGDSWLGNDASPDVDITADEDGREVALFHDANGDDVGQSSERLGTATASTTPTGEPTATVSVDRALPEGANGLLAYAVAGQTRSEPDRATLILDLTRPAPVAAVTSGDRVIVTFTEPVFGRNLATEWEVSEGGPVTSVSVGGSQAERVLEVVEPVPPGARITWTPADGGGDDDGTLPLANARTASSHAGGLESYHDRVGNHAERFGVDVTDVFPPVADILDGHLEGGSEGDSGTRSAVFDVVLDRAGDDDARIRWVTAEGTAEGGSDYRSSSGTVTIPAGQRSGQIRVDVLGDTVVEDDEFFRVHLTGADNAAIGRDRATVTIVDDDALSGDGGGGGGGGDVGSGIEPEGGFVAVPGGVRRLWGTDRVETSVAISQATWDSAEAVVIATSEKYPDALAGAALAARHDAPLLLTPRASLHPAVAQEVERLGATRAFVLGGGAAVAGVVDDDLRERGVEAVHRFAGADRFETARLIARAVGGDRVFVVEGAHADPNRGWPDAVSVSFLSAFQQAPILLVTHDRLPGPTAQALADLGPTHGTIVGGTAAVAATVAAEVDARVGDLDRLAGRTRYGTSTAVARRALRVGLDHRNQWFGSGRNWPDSLTGAPAVARTGGVFLLVDPERLDNSPPIREWLVEFRGRIDSITLLGGVKALSEVVADQIASQARM